MLYLRTKRHSFTLRYATIYAYLRANGRPIPTNDLWIAAMAMEHSVPLLTADRHFQHVPHILLEFMPPLD